MRIKYMPDGRPYVRPYLGRTPDGRPIRPQHVLSGDPGDVAALEAEARAWLERVHPEAAAGVGASHRLGDMLERYVLMLEQNGHSANTVRTYRSRIRYAAPIARRPVREVRTYDVEMLFHHLIRPKGQGGLGLSNNTAIQFGWFLSGAFGWMASHGIVDHNPVRDATMPERGVYEAECFEGQDFEAISAALEGLRGPCDARAGADELRKREVGFAAYLALHTGMRVGEVCALRQRDARLARGHVHVGGTVVEVGGVRRQSHTKGKKSRNVAVSAAVADAIRAHGAAQAERLGRRGPDSPLVSVDGGIMRPTELSHDFSALCRSLGLGRGLTFHSLRHTHATMLLADGVDVKTVSERLGHSSPRVTMDIYAHVLPGRDAQAAEAFSRIAAQTQDW